MKIELSRKTYFSAAHRYFNPQWSEAKNKEVFGRCYSPHGHGHNYVLEATVVGPVALDTGMIINLTELDQALNQFVVKIDHKHLNYDLPEFQDKVPTTENLALYCFKEIQKNLSIHPEIQLSRVRLWENDELWVEVRDA